MRNLFLVAMVLVSTLMFGQIDRQSNKQIDRQYQSFANMKFGISVDVIPNLIFVESSKNRQIKFYERTDEAKTLGIDKIDKVIYGFFKDKLCLVNIKFKDKPNKTILRYDKEIFDKRYKENVVNEDYVWDGKQIILK